jgi:hypothetical protein
MANCLTCKGDGKWPQDVQGLYNPKKMGANVQLLIRQELSR